MPREAYLAIAICLIIALIIIFVVSFVLYKRTPVPKGCESLEIDEQKCASCDNKNCFIKTRIQREEKEEKIK